MKKIVFRWKNDRMTIMWPDHPLVMAGDNVLYDTVEKLEKKFALDKIINNLINKFNVSHEESEAYVNGINEALAQSGVLVNDTITKKSDLSILGCKNLSMATLNITRKCNLQCRHCYAEGGKNKNSEMSVKDVEKLVFELGNTIIRNPKLLIISGGEPTLEIEKLKKAVKIGNNVGLNIRLNTNGYFIDKKLANFLSENEVLVQVSLDGHNSKINSLLRASEKSFDNAILAIKNLVNAGCRTRISCTTHSENFEYIPKMIELSQNLGVEQFTTSSLVLIGNAVYSNRKMIR